MSLRNTSKAIVNIKTEEWSERVRGKQDARSFQEIFVTEDGRPRFLEYRIGRGSGPDGHHCNE